MTTIESSFHNKYSLVKGAARRARQLQSGAQPLIAAKSTKACRVAQVEISVKAPIAATPSRSLEVKARRSRRLFAFSLFFIADSSPQK